MANKKQELTVHQKAALIDYDKPILISASAGSGKTFIMIERIFKYLKDINSKTKERGDLDKIIVLTFTNSAAAEMKDRLFKRISEEIQQSSGDIAIHFRKQIEKLNNAMIGTIDSFCKNIYNKYFERIDLDANLSILEKIEDDAIIYQVIDEKIEEYVSEPQNKYKNIFEALSDNRTFNNLKEDTYKVIQHMLLFPKLDEFPRNKNSEELIKIGEDIDFFILGKEEDDKKYPLEKFIEDMHSLGRKKKYIDIEKQFIDELVSFAKECMEKIIVQKQERGVASFADMERYAYDILSKDNCALAKEMAKDIDMIFIDEYQDTNEMQEAIINTFGVKNLFYVGDIKQSIYKFRNAEPVIFERRLKKYSENINPEDVKKIKDENDYKKIYAKNEGVVIYFDSNFRSSTAITNFVNIVFAKNMTTKFGKVDYENTSMMEGIDRRYYDAIPAVVINETQNLNVKLSAKDIDDNNKPYSAMDALKNVISEKQKKVIEEETSIERQTVNYIKRCIGQDMDDGKGTRKINYGDFAILVRSKNAAKGIVEELQKEQIPYESFLELSEENEDISLFVALLKILDNPYQDISLIQVLLSFFGGFTTEELAIIKKTYVEEVLKGKRDNKQNFHEAFFGYPKKDEIKNKILEFEVFLDKYRNKALSQDVATLIMTIATETGYDAIMMYESIYRIEFFNSFVYYLRGREIGKTIKAFLFAIQDGNLSSVLDDMTKISLKDDCVKIMTIHKSKGLEFPIVILPDTVATKSYSTKDLEYHINLGYGVKIKDPTKRVKTPTFKHNLIKYKNKIEYNEEEMRVYYVALTRAQNHLFILVPQDYQKEQYLPNKCNDLSKLLSNTFMKEKETENDKTAKEETEKEETTKEEETTKGETDIYKSLELKCENYTKNNDKIFIKDFYKPSDLEQEKLQIDYVYPYENTLDVKAKHTASAVQRKEVRENIKEIKVSLNRGKSIDKGIAYHKVLELIDFNKTSLKDVKMQVEKLIEQKFISEGDVNVEHIYNVVNLNIFDKVRQGKAKLLREQRFYYRDSAQNVLYEADTVRDKITIQGVIDAVVVTDDGAIILDYKYSSKDEDILKDVYIEQLRIYKLAIENILNIKVKKTYLYSIVDNTLIDTSDILSF